MSFFFLDPEIYKKYKDEVLALSNSVQVNINEHLPAEKRRGGLSDKQIAEKAEQERNENKSDHPEVWAAIRALRKARDEVEYSRNEKQKYKDSALKSINQALSELEALMARD